MSLITRETGRASGDAFFNGIVGRMVNLPRSIIEGVSRTIGHRVTPTVAAGRRDQQQRATFQWQHPQEPPLDVPEECAFLASFEQQYGFSHPFFFACSFANVLKMAEDEHEFVFIYLHSPDHPFTAPFCTNTLCCELVIQFLDANFASWGAFASKGEGLPMVDALQAEIFPFCAIVAPSGNSIAVLRQVEGPVSPTELVEILQRVIEEQGLAFGSGREKEEEKRKIDRQLREEQDAAYLASLKIDKEKERTKELAAGEKVQKPVEVKTKANSEKLNRERPNKIKATSKETQRREIAIHGKDPQTTQILIRFPNGERRERSFLCTDKIHSVYRYIDSLNLPGIGSYRLISSFPRKVYGYEQMGMTLKDAGLHPRATLFLEIL